MSGNGLSFETLLREKEATEAYINQKVAQLKESGWWEWLLHEYERESAIDPQTAYPSQGLQKTPYDNGSDNIKTETLNGEFFEHIIHAWVYYLELFNHEDRLEELFHTSAKEFHAPQKKFKMLFFIARLMERAIAVNELALHVRGSEKHRTKRTERFRTGPFVKLGRHPRSIFVGSANPDIWGSAPAIASMIQAQCLCGIPRDGFFNEIQQQVDLVKKVFEWLEKSPVLVGKTEEEKQKLLEYWKHNAMGVLEADPKKALERADALYEAGVRTFRIYSPEPGTGPLETLTVLRQKEKQNHWEPIEIFVGQVVDVQQAAALEKAGADGLYVGIGGGGRCTTGKRSGAPINWPQLVWKMRGKVHIPIIIEGGASDNIAQSIAVGATGIGVTRAAGGGTVESPGGYRYFVKVINDVRKLYKYYRGEASAGMKAMGGRIGPFDVVPYVEGESTEVFMEFGRGDLPTILQKLYLLFGDAILAMVFQNVDSIEELQNVGADSLRQVTPAELELRNTH